MPGVTLYKGYTDSEKRGEKFYLLHARKRRGQAEGTQPGHSTDAFDKVPAPPGRGVRDSLLNLLTGHLRG